ncbi:bifunctional alpha/beta hydrolase/OsmC family protein [Magnetovibrio sp.]|uniref:bifunctional alpha/beta hydrolase/OsmC family protein n=1 Tax=Magnetovibrio sp. TaxID=2024836 RepID=UPI002F92D7DE
MVQAPHSSEKVTFPGGTGAQLAARLDMPDGEPRAFALFAHCFTCTKDLRAVSRLAGGLTGHGIAVLRFDFTGLGSSEGEFANTNFTSNIDDLVAAADWLRAHHQAPQILIGHSLGGAAVLAGAHRVPECKAVATIGAPFDPEHVTGHFGDDLHRILDHGSAEVSVGGRPFTIERHFLEDISAHNMRQAITELGRALIIFHAPRDEVVGIDNAEKIFVAAKHPKSFVSLDDADHLLHNPDDALYVSGVIAAWAESYIEVPKAEGGEELPGTEGDVVVWETGNGKFQQHAAIGGRHYLMADEPVAYGGLGSGPSPYDLLLAGLGACTSMTLRMYADHKKLPLDKVTVRLRHDKIHAEDCHECQTKNGKVDVIEREVVMEGDLDPATRARLLEIADRCPVHKTLHAEVKIVTHEGEPQPTQQG